MIQLGEGQSALIPHILLVHDDDEPRRSLTLSLQQLGYRVSATDNPGEVLTLSTNDPPDLMLLDTDLPGMDGLKTLLQFERITSAPVIVLSAQRGGPGEVLALELGADDYIRKPCPLDVLLARVKTSLRRVQRGDITDDNHRGRVVVGDIVVDPTAHEVTLGGQRVPLSPREFDLLYVLASEIDRVVPLEKLLSRVWGPDYQGEPQVVYVHIRWLREKLEQDPSHPQRIITVRGIGYKLESQEHRPQAPRHAA